MRGHASPLSFHAAGTGALTSERIAGTLGQLLAGSVLGRRDETEITLFDSAGMAVQELYIAAYALAAAARMSDAGVVDVDLA